MPVPDQLPHELQPPSAKDLDDSVQLVKGLLDSTSRSRSPLSGDHRQSTQRIHSFNNNGASLGSKRDATIYKHNDSEEHVYQPRNRHVDHSAIRASDDDRRPSIF